MRVLLLLVFGCLLARGQTFEFQSLLGSDSSLSSGLVSYWRLEGAAPTWKDEGSAGNNLSSNNSEGTAPGASYNAVNLIASSNQFLSIANNSTLDLSVDFTLSCWVKFTTLPAVLHYPAIVGKYGASPNSGILLYSNGDSGGKIYANYSTNGTAVASMIGPVVATNTWYWCCFWRQTGTNFLTVDNGAATFSISANPIFNSTANFVIGKFLPSSHYLDGVVDEVGFWHRALSTNERVFLYTNSPPNAVHFPFSHR